MEHRPTIGTYSRSAAGGTDVSQSAILREVTTVRSSVIKNRNKKASPIVHRGLMLPKKKNGNIKMKPPPRLASDKASSRKPAAIAANPIRTSAKGPLKGFTRSGLPHKPLLSALIHEFVNPSKQMGSSPSGLVQVNQSMPCCLSCSTILLYLVSSPIMELTAASCEWEPGMTLT